MEHLLYDSMKELKDDIDYHKYHFRHFQKKDAGLFDLSDDRLLIINDSTEKVYECSIKGRYPSLKEIKECYEIAVSRYHSFKILYDCIIREWDSFQDKFKGEQCYPSDEYITITLLKNYRHE